MAFAVARIFVFADDVAALLNRQCLGDLVACRVREDNGCLATGR